MKGIVLNFNNDDGNGVIRGEDGGRYTFCSEDVEGSEILISGSSIDFVPDGEKAKEIFMLGNASATQSAKKVLGKGLKSGIEIVEEASGLVKKANMKSVISRWFDGLCQFGVIIVTLGSTIVGFISGGAYGYGHFNIAMAIGGGLVGLLLGLLLSVLFFGVLFTLIETRDASRRSVELLEKLLKK